MQDRDAQPTVLWQNWGKNLDGASLVTAVVHDRRPRRGALRPRLHDPRRLDGRRPTAASSPTSSTSPATAACRCIGMNDSAGAYVPAGIGGLDGYAEAFTALRKISGVVPSIMCMFGYNAGGGSYLPRQGSFMIQPADTFFGLTGPGVIKSVLGEDVTPDDLGGPKVHGASGVVDLTVAGRGRRRSAPPQRLLSYLPNSNARGAAALADLRPDRPPAPPRSTRCCARRSTRRPASTRRSTSRSSSSASATTATTSSCSPTAPATPSPRFGRLGGHVVGFVANNSAVASGQIDVDAAFKIARFVRFCSHLQHARSSSSRTRPASCPAAIRRAAASCRPGAPCSTRSSTSARRASC